ncbi:hypothetical protein [Azospirillum formosense]|uniref:hypothetical protein n=1 Tax=Azospirillum formosense TaxID=861533 RepID=UPI00157B3EFF
METGASATGTKPFGDAVLNRPGAAAATSALKYGCLAEGAGADAGYPWPPPGGIADIGAWGGTPQAVNTVASAIAPSRLPTDLRFTEISLVGLHGTPRTTVLNANLGDFLSEEFAFPAFSWRIYGSWVDRRKSTLSIIAEK